MQRIVDRRVHVYISTQWMGVDAVNIVDLRTITGKDIGLLIDYIDTRKWLRFTLGDSGYKSCLDEVYNNTVIGKDKRLLQDYTDTVT